MNIKLVAVLAILATLLTGCGATEAATVPAATAATVATVEYPSEPEPSGIRGLTVGELLADAWGVGTTESISDVRYTMTPEYVASFDGAVPAFPATYYTVPSDAYPGVSHVFRMVAGVNV